MASALACAHAAGIVHRDLKPSNIMITRDDAVKVLDFGLAKPSAAARTGEDSTQTMGLTSDGYVLGTASYMSPEQIRGQELDHRSDVFSFGLVLYEMLSGRRPFHGGSAVQVMNAIVTEEPARLPDEVPAGLRQIVADCLAKDPAARFESARDLVFALCALAPSITNAAPAQPMQAAARATRRGWLAPALGSVALIATLFAARYLGRPEPLDLSAYNSHHSPPKPNQRRPVPGRATQEHCVSEAIDGRSQVMLRNVDAPSPVHVLGCAFRASRCPRMEGESHTAAAADNGFPRCWEGKPHWRQGMK